MNTNMKEIIGKAKSYIVLLALASPLLLSGGDISMYCLGTPCASPLRGEEWDSGMLPLVVLQVLTKCGGALVCVDSSYLRDSHGASRLVFVRMPVLGMVDGTSLPKTIYRCIGTFSYANTLGAEATIPAFEELSRTELLKIQKDEEKREKAVDKVDEMWASKMEGILKIVSARLKESELADQAAREACAKDLLADKKFGIAYRILIESYVAGSLACKEKDYRVGRLEKFQTESKWLDMLNLICEMHNSNESRTESFFSQLPTGEMQRRIKQFVGNSIVDVKQEIAKEAGVAMDGKEIEVSREIEERILSDWRSELERAGRFEKYPEIEQIQYVVSLLSNLRVLAEIGETGNDYEIYQLFSGWDCMPTGGRRTEWEAADIGIRMVQSQEWQFLKEREKYGRGAGCVRYALGDTNTIFMIARFKTYSELNAIGEKIRGYIKQVEDHEIPPEQGAASFKKACQEAKKFIADNFVKFGDIGVVLRRSTNAVTNAVSAVSAGAAAERISAAEVKKAEVKKDKESLAKAIAGITVPVSTKGNPRVRKIVKMMRDPTIAKIYAKYTGKSCEDEIAAFKSEWEGVSATPNVQSGESSDEYKEKEQEINDRITELKNLCRTWALRKRGLARTPQVVRDAEKEIKDLQRRLRRLKFSQDMARIQAKKNATKEIEEKRNVILKKYHDRITSDLMSIMDALNQEV